MKLISYKLIKIFQILSTLFFCSKSSYLIISIQSLNQYFWFLLSPPIQQLFLYRTEKFYVCFQNSINGFVAVILVDGFAYLPFNTRIEKRVGGCGNEPRDLGRELFFFVLLFPDTCFFLFHALLRPHSYDFISSLNIRF